MAIVDISRADVQTDITDAEKFKFSETASAKLMSMMSDFLYSDKEYAVISELSANAYDVHCQVGKGDVPIEVQLPTNIDQELVVRDYGTGLSEENVYKLLAAYGESTKSESNDQVGFWGIGSKSPAAVTDTWTIVSYFEGQKTHYEVFVASDGVPSIKKMFSVPTDEVGMEVRVPIPKYNFGVWTQAAQKAFRFYPVKPKMNREISYHTDEKVFEGNGWYNTQQGHGFNLTIITTMRGYSVDWQKISPLLSDDVRKVISDAGAIFVEFPVGEIDLSISREQIQFNDKTTKNIVNKLNQVYEDVMAEAKTLLSINDEIAFKKAASDLYAKFGRKFSGAFEVSTRNHKFKIINVPFDFNIVSRTITEDQYSDGKFVHNGICRSFTSSGGRGKYEFSKFASVDTNNRYMSTMTRELKISTGWLKDVVIVIRDDTANLIARIKQHGDDDKFYIVMDQDVFDGGIKTLQASDFPKLEKRKSPAVERCKDYYLIEGNRIRKCPVSLYEELLDDPDRVAYMPITNAKRAMNAGVSSNRLYDEIGLTLLGYKGEIDDVDFDDLNTVLGRIADKYEAELQPEFDQNKKIDLTNAFIMSPAIKILKYLHDEELIECDLIANVDWSQIDTSRSSMSYKFRSKVYDRYDNICYLLNRKIRNESTKWFTDIIEACNEQYPMLSLLNVAEVQTNQSAAKQLADFINSLKEI